MPAKLSDLPGLACYVEARELCEKGRDLRPRGMDREPDNSEISVPGMPVYGKHSSRLSYARKALFTGRNFASIASVFCGLRKCASDLPVIAFRLGKHTPELDKRLGFQSQISSLEGTAGIRDFYSRRNSLKDESER